MQPGKLCSKQADSVIVGCHPFGKLVALREDVHELFLARGRAKLAWFFSEFFCDPEWKLQFLIWW